jgi:hypothetical protein
VAVSKRFGLVIVAIATVAILWCESGATAPPADVRLTHLKTEEYERQVLVFFTLENRTQRVVRYVGVGSKDFVTMVEVRDGHGWSDPRNTTVNGETVNVWPPEEIASLQPGATAVVRAWVTPAYYGRIVRAGVAVDSGNGVIWSDPFVVRSTK